jgi:predicted ATP-grasp superfamily ATP-dependent carboligase
VSCEDDLKKVIDKLKEKIEAEVIFIQELIPSGISKTISFTAFCVNGEIKTHWMGIKIREHPIKFGTSTYSKSTFIPGLIPVSEKLIRELNYSGICEIEFLKDQRDGTYKLIEINARTWLWVDLARRCGINYTLLLYNYLNDIPNVFPSTYDHDKEWIHYIIDLPFSITGIFKRHYTIKEIIGSYLKLPYPAVFKLGDPFPSLAELFLLPLFLLKR